MSSSYELIQELVAGKRPDADLVRPQDIMPFVIESYGRRCIAVLVPTAPVPIGGGLLWVPEAWVTPAAVGVEALTSIYVSMGVTSSQYLPRAGAEAPKATTG